MTIEVYHRICETLRQLIAGTEWEGYVYAVGGCCRDEVIGRDINDVDLAVNLRDGGVRFARWLHGNGLTVNVPTYFERYGTAMLQLRDFPEHEIEIVQTRKGKYTPENATDPGKLFGTVFDDAMRRDFTVNALFYNITSRELIDVTGMGLDDIAAKRLRTPLVPELTFYDDPVRILRCIRMASAWKWHVDSGTLAAMAEKSKGLSEIKPERRRAEFEKMLMCNNPVRAIKMTRRVGAMEYLFPELCYTYRTNNNGGITLWQQALDTVNAVKDKSSVSLHFAALLYVICNTKLTVCKHVKTSGQPVHVDNIERALRGTDIVEVMMRRLHYHSPFLKEVLFLIRNRYCNIRWGDDGNRAGDRMLARLARLCVTPKRLNMLLDFLEAVNIATSASESLLRQQIPNIRKKIAKLKLF